MSSVASLGRSRIRSVSPSLNVVTSEPRDHEQDGSADRDADAGPVDASRIFDEPGQEPTTDPNGVVGPDDEELAMLRDAALMERNAGMVRAGRRIGGMPGAMMAGAMAALRDIYEGPVKQEIPDVREHPGEPHDVDRDGVSLSVDGVDVEAPAQPRTRPVAASAARRRSRIRRR